MLSPSNPAEAQSNRYTSGPALVVYVAAANLLLHLATVTRYGVFRDEMYYYACSKHMAWGYVDHPPLTVWIEWVARHLFGASALGVRLVPILTGCVIVWLTGKLVREFGGNGFAQFIAALAIMLVPIYQISFSWLTDNIFEQIIWLGCIWLVARAVNTGNERYWLWFGILAGVGFQNKYSIAFLLLGILAGVVLTRHRYFLKSKYLWLGVVACALIALPNLLWQIHYHFPFLELIHNIRLSNRDVVRGPVAFVADQAMIMNPILFPLWLGGLVWFLLPHKANASEGISESNGAGRSNTARYRLFGWTYLVVLVAFIALKAKNYYVVPIYPMLFAAGAIGLERITRSSRIGVWGRYAYVALVIAISAVLLPMSVPVLSPESYLRYQKAIGLAPSEIENEPHGPLPQWYADEFGWPEMVEKVAQVYNSLPPEERVRTAIFANGWGEAAAVDFYGSKYGLPPAISKQNSYWIWGPGNYDGSTMIILGSSGRHDREFFQSVEKVGRVEHPYSRRDEYYDILLCRGPKKSLQKMWPQLKLFD